MRIVLDTNILVSAMIVDGKQRALLNTIITKNHKLIISKKIIEEFVKVTAESKIRKYATKEEVARFLHNLSLISTLVPVRSRVKAVRDEKDNPILATAYDGYASYLVTGDDDLLTLKKFKRVKIVKAIEMLTILEQ
ncbi:MAG: putative toxin-antitoxin system toxin component, PIN family [Thaumarchaeota archaeon]|nr:putative toxin-antitoxin system toxin component, PIN family [Nitrososphaerota archaeon]MDE1866150.1 putative toxin-antitoxin system toxin component, PIN family [Nitrososphaerota archaeon]